jgi:O-acetyl-ADP-ribose deacetylase (regulator of RNase III)
MTVPIIEGDLLESDAQYIIHQTNCVSHGASGLAYFLFDKFPYADVYAERKRDNIWHKPGNIYIRGGNGDRLVINAMGQFMPGGPGGETQLTAGVMVSDTPEQRINYFLSCMSHLINRHEEENLESIDFPWRIGCGLGNGDWDYYRKIINSFAKKVPQAQVRIIKRPEDE